MIATCLAKLSWNQQNRRCKILRRWQEFVPADLAFIVAWKYKYLSFDTQIKGITWGWHRICSLKLCHSIWKNKIFLQRWSRALGSTCICWNQKETKFIEFNRAVVLINLYGVNYVIHHVTAKSKNLWYYVFSVRCKASVVLLLYLCCSSHVPLLDIFCPPVVPEVQQMPYTELKIHNT